MAIQQMLLGGAGEVSLINATGGDEIVTSGNFRYHKFNTSGTFQFTYNAGYNSYVRVWVLGGGYGASEGQNSRDGDGRNGAGGGLGGYSVVTTETGLDTVGFAFSAFTCVVAGPGYNISTVTELGLNSSQGGPTYPGSGGTGVSGAGPWPFKNGGNGQNGMVVGPFTVGGSGGGGGGGGNSIFGGGPGLGGVGSFGAGSGGQGGAYSSEVENAFGWGGQDAAPGSAGGGGGGGGAGGSLYATEENVAQGGPGGQGAGGCIIFRYQYKGF